MNIEMTIVECAWCHISFSITDKLYQKLCDCHNTFYCPMGHTNYYPAKSAEEKLREQLREKSNQLNEIESQLRVAKETLAKKAVTKRKSKKAVKA